MTYLRSGSNEDRSLFKRSEKVAHRRIVSAATNHIPGRFLCPSIPAEHFATPPSSSDSAIASERPSPNRQCPGYTQPSSFLNRWPDAQPSDRRSRAGT
jgi:hypothetical protein